MIALYAIILGVVQGLCEFLPVSSSGHLVLLQNLFGLSEGALAESALLFNVLLHVGTLVAVFVVFWRDIVDILKHPLGKKMRYLILATIPAVLGALFLNDLIDESFSGAYLGFCFLLTAVLLTVAELLSRRQKKKKDVGAGSALAMGIMQVVGIFPGVSRSGSTISGGLFCGVNRSKVARFSFLMSIPAILGSLILEGKDLFTTGVAGVSWGIVILGMVVSAVTGFFAIRFMLRIIASKKLYGFALYTLLLGIAVLTGNNLIQILVLCGGIIVFAVMAILGTINRSIAKEEAQQHQRQQQRHRQTH